MPIAGQSSANATAVAFDAAGDVVVTGGGASAAATLKLSGSSGAIVWGPVLEDGATAPSSLSIFGNGDVLVDVPTSGSPSHRAARAISRVRRIGSLGPFPIGSQYFDPYTSPSFVVVSSGNVFVASDFVVNTLTVTQALEVDGGTGRLAWGPLNLVPPAVGTAYLDDLSAGPTKRSPSPVMTSKPVRF